MASARVSECHPYVCLCTFKHSSALIWLMTLETDFDCYAVGPCILHTIQISVLSKHQNAPLFGLLWQFSCVCSMYKSSRLFESSLPFTSPVLHTLASESERELKVVLLGLDYALRQLDATCSPSSEVLMLITTCYPSCACPCFRG